MKRAVLLSIAFHVSIFVLLSFTIPYFEKNIEPIEMAITVDIADLIEEKPIPDSDNKEPKQNKNKAIYNNTDTLPYLLESKALKDIEEDISLPPADKPKIEKKRKLENQSPPPKPKNKPRVKKKPKPDPPKEQKEVKKDQKDFTSLLKSLASDEDDIKQSQEKGVREDISKVDNSNNSNINFTSKITNSEIEALNRGVEPCWNVNAGGKDAHKLIVELMVFVNQDRTVRDVKIIDKARYNNDTHFRAAAEAARRALLNPNCSTLNLPPEKYDRWKKFRYIFDPSNML